MKRLLPIVVLSLMALPAGLRGEEGAQATVSAADCRWLIKHVPDDDVAYKPGVDVRGRKVVPADLNGSGSIEVPKEIPIDLVIPLRLLPESVAAPILDRAEINAGRVTVDRITGAVMYNGQRVGDSGQEHLVAACRARLK